MWVAGCLAALALPCATAVAASRTGAQPVAYGAAQDWGGTQIRALDCPVPPLPAPAGCSTTNSSGSGSSPTAVPAVPSDQILSDERSFTQWAYVSRIANIYSQPSIRSHVITKLTWFTEDGFNSIYLLLRAHWNKKSREWVKIRIPGRPNGRVGWVERNALGRFHLTHLAVVVNRRKERLFFYKAGHVIWSAPVGIGAPSMPTPAGHFWINERFVITDPANGYYPYAFGTTDYSTLTDWPGGGVVGIHGPFGAPASAIPGRISHGCIRLRIPDDFWLGRHMQLGTPVRVV